jgi:hypothetical protein
MFALYGNGLPRGGAVNKIKPAGRAGRKINGKKMGDERHDNFAIR